MLDRDHCYFPQMLSKAFDKAWREGIIFKLKQNGVSDGLQNILSNFLRNVKQRVTLNGQSSSWTNVNAGVTQRSNLGPLRFLIYIFSCTQYKCICY